MKGRTNLSWAEVDMLVLKLALDLKDCDFKNIHGIPRGGLIPAVMLSHRLNLPLTDRISKDTLVVDDICDTGKTLEAKKYSKCFTATLILRGSCKWGPEFYGQILDTKEWVVFPWETIKSTK